MKGSDQDVADHTSIEAGCWRSGLIVSGRFWVAARLFFKSDGHNCLPGRGFGQSENNQD